MGHDLHPDPELGQARRLSAGTYGGVELVGFEQDEDIGLLASLHDEAASYFATVTGG